MIHIIPISDSKDHYAKKDCHCNPKITTKNKNGAILAFGPLVIHQPFDKRETHKTYEEYRSDTKNYFIGKS